MSAIASSRGLAAVLFATTALAAAAAVAPAVAGTVSGTVSDASGTGALRGAEVTIVELGKTATVQADGSFRFANVPAGNYALRVRYAGAADQTQQVNVPATGDVSARFELQASAGGDATVLVIGQRANLSSSISRQRSADGVQTTLSRDSIGQFPDQNVAESIRRAPGVNVLNDQGEGRFVSVRGLDPNLNSSSINGNRILSTGGDDRMVAMDVIPSELIESIDIKKTLTPDMDADTIGASIEINTTSVFDRKKNLLSASLEGSYNDLNEKTSPKGSLDFSYKVTPDFGFAGGLSYYNRKFSTDNIELADWDENGNDVFARTVEYRDYDVQRERYGFTLNFDYRVSENTSLYLRTFYSKFDDTEQRGRLVFKIDELNPTVSGDKVTFLSAGGGSAGRIEIRRDIKDRREWQETSNVAVGGKTFVDAWKFTYDLSYAQASQSEDGSIDPMRFRNRFAGGTNQLGVTFDYSDLENPTFLIDPTKSGAAAFSDATKYTMTAFERTTEEDAEDEETTLRFDAARSFGLASGSFELKFGGKVRQRNKHLDMTYDIYDGYDGALTLADVAGKPTYGLADIGVVPDLGKVRNLVANNIANFERNDDDSVVASTVEDYQASEDVTAGYIQGRYDNGALRIVGGVRVEQTKLDLQGTLADLDAGTFTPVQFKKDYTDVLPSVNVRYNVSDRLVTRFAVSQSLMRPSFGKMAPRFVIEENDDGEIDGTFGNPDLDPYKATNLDASVEYYFAKEAVIQGGIFAKKIKDFIVTFSTDDAGTYNGVAYDNAEYSINGDEADVFGFELAYAQALTFLPAPFDGLLLNANYTFTDAEGDIQDGATTRTIPLPAAAKHTANLVVGYEKGPLSLRAAGSYRSGYLDELGGDAESDRYVKDHFQVDLSAKYRVNDNVRIFGELVNANNATYTAYQKGPGRDRLLQYEEYSWTAKFGIKLNY